MILIARLFRNDHNALPFFCMPHVIFRSIPREDDLETALLVEWQLGTWNIWIVVFFLAPCCRH